MKNDENKTTSSAYYSMDIASKTTEKRNSLILWALIIMSVLLVGITIFTIVYVVENPSDSSSSSDCTSTDCVSLANEILTSINSSVDPCDDFFQYACGNFINEYDWKLLDYPAYGEFQVTGEYEKQVFLDTIYYNVDESLTDQSSTLKAINFFEACYDSSINEESLGEDTLLSEFISIINFSSGNNTVWDESTIEGYQNAIAWLTQRDWIYFWSLSVYDTNIPVFTQLYEIWVDYNETIFREEIETIMQPLYESIFGLNASEASQMSDDVIAFANQIASITTATSAYSDYTYLASAYRNVSDISVFGSSNITNYTNLFMDVFDLIDENDIREIVYYQPDLEYFNNLTKIIASNTPQTVQYFLFTNVLIYTLNFDDVLEQSRYTTRSDYCYEQILSGFPFIFGYISDKYMYDDETQTMIYNMIVSVTNDGIKTGLNKASWLDEESLENSLLKVEYLGIYVGLPPQISNITALNIYYENITINGDDYISSLESLLNFNVYIKQASLKGTLYDLISPWPSAFRDSSIYKYWLTGINAFYEPSGNYFTIPITISQKTFFNKNYPSSINFGGIGSVIGHEISHGFDPSGSLYDYEGNYDDIWTDETRADYDEIVDCIITQYNGMEISNGTYVDGNTTQTEDVADNGGLSASYMAWKKWKKKYSSQSFTLPGVDLSETQLFFLGWARNWCQAYRSNYYDDWTNVHAPAIARVWGAVQNMDEFADAFNCKTNDAMNPEDKCQLWA